MTAVLLSIVPVFGVLVLGWVLRASKAFPAEQWPVIERLTYFVLFPCLLFSSLVRSELDPSTAIPIAASIVFGLMMTACGLPALRKSLATDDPGFTSVFQGSIRPNVYIGLAVIAAIWGEEGIALAGICVAATMPLVNALSVIMLSRYGTSGRKSVFGIIKAMAQNPIIVSVVLGVAYSLSGLPLPLLAERGLDVLGRAALALGLLSVGAGLMFEGLGRQIRPMLIAVVVKLLINPILIVPGILVFGLSGLPALIPMVFNGLPVAPSAYILSRQMGGDAKLMAAITTLTTLVSMITLPLLVVFGQWLWLSGL